MAEPERDAAMIVANMVEAALAGGLADDRRRQDHGGPSGTVGGGLCAPVDHCPGARAHRVDRSSIRAGAGSCAAWVERWANLDNRRRSRSIRPNCVGSVRVQGAGGSCLRWRGGSDSGTRGITPGAEFSRLAAPARIVCSNRHFDHRQRWSLRSRLFQRPLAAGLEGHYERGGIAFTRGPPAGRQARCCTTRRTAFPAAGRLRL
jgi:hypothetical protein